MKVVFGNFRTLVWMVWFEISAFVMILHGYENY